MDLKRLCYRYSNCRCKKLTLVELLEKHRDPMYQILKCTNTPLATMTYAAYNGDLFILRAVLSEYPNLAPKARLGYECRRKGITEDSRLVIKEFMKTA